MQNNNVAAILLAFVGSGLISYAVITHVPLKDCAPVTTTTVSSENTSLKPTLIDDSAKLKSTQDDLNIERGNTEKLPKIATLPPVYLQKHNEPYTLPPVPPPRLPAYPGAAKYDVFAGQLEKIRVTNVFGTEQDMRLRAVSDNGYMKEAVLLGRVGGYEPNSDTVIIEFTSFSHNNRSHSITARAVAKRDQVKALANMTTGDTPRHIVVDVIFLNQFNFRKIYSASYDGY